MTATKDVVPATRLVMGAVCLVLSSHQHLLHTSHAHTPGI